MKKIYTLFVALLCATSALAQHTSMYFTGPSRFGVGAMNAWQENESDTVRFAIANLNFQTGTGTASITLPNLFFQTMGYTLLGFTLEGIPFTSDAQRNNTLQSTSGTTTVTPSDGREREVQWTLNSGTYDHSAQQLTLDITINRYGSMPFPVAYTATLVYNREVTTGIQSTQHSALSTQPYDLQGRKASTDQRGIIIQGGKKVLRK